MDALFQKIDRYLLRQLGIALVVVTASLICVIWLSRSLRFVDYIINRGVSFSTFAYLTSLLLPSLLDFILPITLFISVLFTYSRLSQDNEVTISYAAGLSPRRVARPAVYLCLIVVMVSYFFSAYLIPVSFRAFKNLQFEIRHAFSATLLEEGVFMDVNDYITVYVRERKSSGELAGILVHDTTNAERPVTIIAEKGALVDTAEGPRVYVAKGQRQEYDRGLKRTSLLYFDEYVLDLNQNQELPGGRWREPRERFIPELISPPDADKGKRYYSELLTEGHQRILHPLYNLAFGMLAAYFMLMGRFNRRGDASKIFYSVCVLVIWQAAALGAQNLSSKEAAFIPLMYAVLFLPFGTLAYLMARNIRPSSLLVWLSKLRKAS